MDANTRHDSSDTAPRTTSAGDRPDGFVGCQVVDEHDHEIGTVVDVVYDNHARTAGAPDEQPAWVVIDPGMFRAEHWMPLAGTYRSADGRIVVPWDRELVKHSPKATEDHLMTTELVRRLAEHYEVDTTA